MTKRTRLEELMDLEHTLIGLAEYYGFHHRTGDLALKLRQHIIKRYAKRGKDEH